MNTSARGYRLGATDELGDALRAANYVINRPSEWWASPHLVDFVSATQEIVAWANDKRIFSAKHRKAWTSVLADYTFARKSTGALTQGRIPEIAALDSAVHAMNLTLPNTGDRVPIDPPVLESIKKSAQQVMSEIQKPKVLKEAFDELVRASRSRTASIERLHIARDFFWRLVELRGLDPRGLSDTLIGIIYDEQYHVQQAHYLLGARTERPTARYREETPAGLSRTARFELCRSVLNISSPTSTQAVWLAFQHAHLPTPNLKVGPAAFYDGHLIHSIVDSEAIPDHWRNRLPAELVSDRDAFGQHFIEDADDIVYVRVDLGTGPYSDSIRVARQVAQSVVTLASFTVSTGHWQLCDGFLQVVNGSLSWRSSFARPRERTPIAATIDPTPVALEELSHKLGSSFSTSLMKTDDWAKLLEVLNWRERAKQSEPLARIVLDVRVIETIAGWIGQPNWYKYLDRYHRRSWIRTEINSQIGRIGRVTTNTSARWNMAADRRAHLEELTGKFVRHLEFGQIETDIKEVYLALELISTLIPTGTRIKREVDTLCSKLSSVESLRSWCAALSDQWKLALDRTLRIRNSLTHGGPMNEAAALSVSRFIRSLSGWSVWTAMEAIMASSDVLDAHEAWKEGDDSWMARVASADSVLNALFLA